MRACLLAFLNHAGQYLLCGAALLLLAVGTAFGQEADGLQEHLTQGTHGAELERFYEQWSFEPVWLTDGHPTAQAEALVRILQVARHHGFDPECYGAERLAAEVKEAAHTPLASQSAVVLEFGLTEVYLQYAGHLLRGRVDPRRVHAGWNISGREADLAAHLQASLDAGRLEAGLEALAPVHPEYQRLQRALRRYRTLKEAGGWPALPEGPLLRRGSEGTRVVLLRERLRASGDLAAAHDSTKGFDERLDQAVRAFQQRHGLVVDGIVGPKTRAALNVSVEGRIRQIELNLERWRWLPETLGPRYLQVNVPDFRLEVVEAGEPMLEMRAIVGTRRTPTPLFRSQVTQVVLAPYWHVPRSIAQGEIFPRLERDPGYLARHHMRVLPGGTIRQDPGPTNPLGRVKFIMPNAFAIRLHDTPERHLFAESVCAFSHGCIRIEKPVELAAYLLKGDPAWTQARIEATIARWRETPIDVVEPLPIYVLYWTAWAEADGTVQFRDDVYGHDARLKAILWDESERDEYPARTDR